MDKRKLGCVPICEGVWDRTISPSLLLHPPSIKVMYGQRMDVPLSEPVSENADGWRDGVEKGKKEKECR